MKRFFVFVATIAITMFFSACSSTKQSAEAAYAAGNPFGDVYEMPAAEYDTDDSFGATGTAYGPRAQMGTVHINALTNAQEIVRQKIKHSYKGVVDTYSKSVGNNIGTDIQNKIERAGTQVIDAVVNDTKESQVKFSSVDEKGNVHCYVGIRINKEKLADEVAKAVTNAITEEEAMKIGYGEAKFREQNADVFKRSIEKK